MKKILIVDDSIIRKIIKTDLYRAGYTEFYEASDGLQAVECYDEIHPDITLMDITILCTDGLKTLKEIRKKDSNAVVVILLATGQETLLIKAIKAGVDDYIVKPIKREDIIQIVSKWIPLE